MKTVRTIGNAEDTGKAFGEMMRLMQSNEVIDMVIHYRKQLPILLYTRKGRRHYASARHPKAKQIHTFTLKVVMPKVSKVRVRYLRSRRPMMVHHARTVSHK